MSARALRVVSAPLLLACACGPAPLTQGDAKDRSEKTDGKPIGLLAEVPAGPEPSRSGAGPTRSGAGPAALGKPAKEPVWRRYVAVVGDPADACPKGGAGWSGAPLFRRGDAAALLAEAGKKLPGPLERFCVYTWGGKGAPATPPVFTGADAGKVVRIDADREVVVPQSYLGGETSVRSGLSTRFMQATGAAGSGVSSEVHVGKKGPARVAVVDTVGFADAELGYASAAARQRHGLAMREVVEALRCPNGESECGGQQFFAQAFPYDASSPAPLPSGGPLGSLGSLAYAIGEALVRWRQLAPDTSLVLNLSLGWDPRYGDALTAVGLEASHTNVVQTPSADVPATVQAVHAAMVYATCLQALPIAAAGNNPGSACEQSGLMAPASWERYPAPDEARCAELFGPGLVAWRAGVPGVNVASPRLVYGAGGVDAGGRPIPIARRGGLSPRVLVAMQAVAGSGARQTDAWTGTSVAAASLSGIAAGLWSHAPGMTPHQVAATIDASGAPLGKATPALRITAHAAFERMCLTRYAGTTCPNPYAAPTMPTQLTWPAILMAGGVATGAPTPLVCATRADVCADGTATRSVCGTAPSVAVTRAAEPWVRPQPDIPICPVCPVRGGKLALSLSPEFAGRVASLVDPVLEFRRLDGSYVGARLEQLAITAAGTEVDLARYTVDLGAGAVTLASLLAAEGVTSGVLGFTYTDAAGGTGWLSSVVTVEP